MSDAAAWRWRPIAAAAACALLLSGATAGFAQQAPRSPVAEAVAASPPDLPVGLQRILDHPTLRGARFGMVARLLPEDEVLISYNADELFAPASVNKLFTTAAALDYLGGHYVFETPVAYRGGRSESTVHGDLWVLGRGAPDLVDERLWLAASALRDGGLARITGDVVVDDRYFDELRFGEGWPGGVQVREAYHSPVSALMANFAAERGEGGWVAVQDPALHFGQRFRELLGTAGVVVEGNVRKPYPDELQAVPAPDFSGTDLGAATVPAPLHFLTSIRSEPLGRVIMDINKFSNNVMAESMLKAIGAMEYGAPGTATKGLATVASFLDEDVGIPLNSFIQTDGSGLSRLARFAPSQVSRLLLHSWRDFHIGPELMSSLKISGLDGWSPAAFKRPPLQGELRVKSGHIRGVNTLAGFIHTDSQRLVAFAAMVNEHRAGQWEIDQRMAEIVLWLIRTY